MALTNRILSLVACCVFIGAAQVVPGRYIVELTGEPAAVEMARTTTRQAVADRRAELRARQIRMRSTLQSQTIEVLDSVDTVANALLTRMSEADAARVAAMSGVRRVIPVMEVKLELDHALPLHRVPDAWRRIGGESRAGAGVKIGIIDTGIEQSHAGFQDDSLTVPEGYPKLSSERFRDFTNKKVIVARSYGQFFSNPDLTPADRVGHGTAVAMTAAGVRNDGPLGTITGVAPKAFLGNYSVFNGIGSTRTDVILKAIDDAVADGMDVINLSLGSEPAPRDSLDILVEAVERAARANVIVVKSAGNSGPNPSTLTSPAGAPSGIAVGASFNDRIFMGPTVVAENLRLSAVASSDANLRDFIEGLISDVATLDPNGLACNPLPAESLAGKVAFILRGECTFEVKLNQAQAAGAIAAVVYTDAERPDPVIMAIGQAKLPAVMLSNANGVRLKTRIAERESLPVTVRFRQEPILVPSNRMSSFSSAGPDLSGYRIKPDIAAVGVQVYTATEKDFQSGELFDARGYTVIDGTSFSSPLVAGAVAVVRGSRPDLDAARWSSLIVNSASPLELSIGGEAGVQSAGGGLLNLDAALASTAAAAPTSISFGAGGGTIDARRELSITNVGSTADTFAITVQQVGGSIVPSLSSQSLTLGPGESGKVEIRLAGSNLDPGEVQGFFHIRSSTAEVDSRVPYWYAVRSNVARFINFFNPPTTGSPGGTVQLMIRVTDAAGVPLAAEPEITVIGGGGSVGSIDSQDAIYPGVFRVRLRLGLEPGTNTFRFKSGDLQRDLTVRGGL